MTCGCLAGSILASARLDSHRMTPRSLAVTTGMALK